jgi:hypothetical protein
MFGGHPEAIEISVELIRDGLEKTQNKSVRESQGQLFWIGSGGVFYIIWHVTEMYLRTPGHRPF